MQILLNVPDEYEADFLTMFVPSGTLDVELYGREDGRRQYLSFTADLEQVHTDHKNHRDDA